MKIVVNDIAASMGGAMTVLRDFYAFICENDKENQWIFLLNDKYFEETENVKILTLPHIKRSRLRKLWFDFFSGRRFIGRLQPDIVLSLQNIITFGLKIPQVVFIHQSIPFQNQKRFSFLKSEERELAVIQHWIGRIIKQSAKKANRVIVQTEWMRQSVMQQCKLSEDKVLVSVPGIKAVPLEAQKCIFSPKEFFYPTAPLIYKNNDCVYAASAMLDYKGIEHTVTLTLPSDKSKGSVRCVGRLLYATVMANYRRSTLIFPSYIETFGYPLAEARQAGTIILAADTAFSREVLADYENAYFFDPFCPKDLAGLMEQVALGNIIKKPSWNQSKTPTNGWKVVLDLTRDLGSVCNE